MTTLYVIKTNTDLSEGRGYIYPLAVCSSMTTATRLARGKYIQGGDCPIEEVETITIGSKRYLPFDAVPIQWPTNEDRDNDRRKTKLETKLKLLSKLRLLGLTDEEISILQM